MSININDFCPLDGDVISIHDDGKEWFCAESIRRALQNGKQRITVNPGYRDVVLYTAVDDARLVSEDEFYLWILSSTAPAAERFRSWVMTVVMPTIIEDKMYIYGEEKSFPTPACDDPELLFWRDKGTRDDEVKLINLIKWWTCVVGILKEIRRDQGYLLNIEEFTNREPMSVNRQALTKAVTKKVERQDRLKRATA